MLTVESLRQKRLERARINHETYKLLYGMCATKINDLNKLKPPVTSFIWNVPPIYPGRPLYDQQHALRYIRDKLLHGGFSITQRPPSQLDIRWDKVTQAPARKKKQKHSTPSRSTKQKERERKRKPKTLADKAAMAERLTSKLTTLRR